MSSCRLLPNQALTHRRGFRPTRPITHIHLAALTERVRRRVIRWFKLSRLLDAAAAADMLVWENSGFSVDASVRITLIDRALPSYFQSLEHLFRYYGRPPFALDRLSVIRGPDGRVVKVRYVLPRHKAANWAGPRRGRKSTRTSVNGVVELSPFESWTAWPISCRLRESTGIGITGCLRRITSSDGPSRHSPSGTSASNARRPMTTATSSKRRIDEVPAIDIHRL